MSLFWVSSVSFNHLLFQRKKPHYDLVVPNLTQNVIARCSNVTNGIYPSAMSLVVYKLKMESKLQLAASWRSFVLPITRGECWGKNKISSFAPSWSRLGSNPPEGFLRFGFRRHLTATKHLIAIREDVWVNVFTRRRGRVGKLCPRSWAREWGRFGSA